MVKIYTLIIALIILLSPLSNIAGAESIESSDLNFITDNNHTLDNYSAKYKRNYKRYNIIRTPLLTPIRFYQVFISSQDLPTCQFTPTCSQYSAMCYRKYGVFQGTLMTLDRLSRCNGNSRYDYKLDPVTGKAVDPPEEYDLFRSSKSSR